MDYNPEDVKEIKCKKPGDHGGEREEVGVSLSCQEDQNQQSFDSVFH